ncbi:MAG TPA: hypothetical protein VMI30_02385 [Stellaceae bacterium]|nr:hypothetical protein [Stellaceae bacterium]
MIHAVTEYAAVAAVFGALTGIGTLPARLLSRAHDATGLLCLPLFVMAGWGIAAFLSALGAIVDANQAWLAWGILIVGWLLLLPFSRTLRAPRFHLLGDLLILSILVAPMGLLVASTPAMAFDEFAQWLPNTRYLVEHAHYWSWPDWLGVSSKPGYPNASAFIPLMTAQLVGLDVEAPFKTFVVLLLGAFGAGLASLVASRWSIDPARVVAGWAMRAALLAGGCLIALVNPFMDPRVGFTAYTDTASAIIIAITVLAASNGVRAARQHTDDAAAWFGWAGLLSLTLVLLRQTNLILVLAVIGGSGLLLLLLRAGTFRLRLGWALLLIVPPTAGGLAWQAHLWAARIGPDISPRPLAAWDWTAPMTVLRAFMLDRLAGNPTLGVAALIIAIAAVVAGVAGWRRLSDRDDAGLPPARLVVSLGAIVGLCFVVFLAWSYIAVFSAAEVASAASLWRYLSELGPMIVIALGCVGASLLPRRYARPSIVSAAAGLAIGLLFLLPFAGRRYYRLDCRFPDVAAARAAVAELRPALSPFAAPAPAPARVAVVNPTMGDWMAYALAFDMRWPASNQLVRFRVRDEPFSVTEAWAWDQGIDALLDFSPLDRAKIMAQGVIPAVSLLRRPAAKGEAWPLVATTHSRPLPACQAWDVR